MLHVFLVDIGIMLKFEMELAVDSVSRLMEAVQQVVFIPANKQVLLSANGEPLNPTNRVASYASAGTETQPIYLFSKSTIESPVPPSQGVNPRAEASLKEEVEKSLKMKPKYETLVMRAKLALEFQRVAVDLGNNCENLLNDQVLQKKGWNAVIKNLDHNTSAFKSHVSRFEQFYRKFQIAHLQYHNMLQSFRPVFDLLRQLPLFDCLPGVKSGSQLTLLQWISSHDQQSSIDNLVNQCQNAIKQCNLQAMEEIISESNKVLDSVDNFNMKDIKGLNERLASLQHRVNIIQQLVQDQTDMAQGFQQNQMRAEHIGDPSVLPDLCASHQKQLIVLLKNQHQIREIHNLCAKAKDELSANLHARLRWVMYVERSIYEHDSKLLVYHESLRRIKKRLDIFEQVYEAPKMYVLAVLEVLRRKTFSEQFSEWCSSISQSSVVARTEELGKRRNFQKVFNNHFVKNLFPGLDQEPQPFAEDPLEPCDDSLPNISVDDIKLLQHCVPDLMCELRLGDPLITSMLVRDTLSQSNLSKLLDPQQNKTLEETLNFREKALVDNNLFTMSVLKREIECKNVDAFLFDDDVQFNVDGIKECSGEEGDVQDHDFGQPASLKSLPEDKRLMGSSDSDALFHSAELDFACADAGLSPMKSPKSSKSSSSPIAIKGWNSFHKLSVNHCRSFSPQYLPANETGNILSLPLPSNAKVKKLDRLSFDSDVSISNSRSLSEAIKSTEVVKNILDSAEILKTSKLQIADLKKQFSSTRTDIEDIQNEFANSLKDLKEFFVQIYEDMSKQVKEDCKDCHCLQAKLSKREEDHEKDLKILREQYMGVLSDKDKEYMENATLVAKLSLLSKENEDLTQSVNNLENDISVLRKRLEETFAEINNKDIQINTLSIERDNLLTGNKLVNDDIENMLIEKNELKKELEELKVSSELSFDRHIEQVSTSNTQVKELKKFEKEAKGLLKEKDQRINRLENLLSERDKMMETKENELSELLQRKDTLEVQNQSNFNVVFNKIRKDKDSQICEMKENITQLEKQVSSFKHRNETLHQEIDVHKAAYSEIQGELNTAKQKCVAATLAFDTAQLENDKLTSEMKEISVNLETVKEEKLRVIQELKSQYDDALEKEKASLLLAFEIEKEYALEELGKSETVIRRSKSISIEEGIDELEIDRLHEQVKMLEMENCRLKGESSTASINEDKICQVTNGLNKLKTEKIHIRNIEGGSMVVLCLDEQINQYTVLTLTQERYFLHPDSVKLVRKILERPGKERRWMFAYVIEREYCTCKKANNRFQLPVNSYFSRVRIKPIDFDEE